MHPIKVKKISVARTVSFGLDSNSLTYRSARITSVKCTSAMDDRDSSELEMVLVAETANGDAVCSVFPKSEMDLGSRLSLMLQ